MDLHMKKVKVQYRSRRDVIPFVHFTDTHIGSASCDEEMLKRDIAAIGEVAKKRRVLVGMGGDIIDGITSRDPRYTLSSLAKWCQVDDPVGAQIDRAVGLFSPIAKHIIYAVYGNHELTSEKHYGFSFHGRVVTRLAAKAGRAAEDIDMKAGGIVKLQFERKTGKSTGSRWPYYIFTHHFTGNANTPQSVFSKLLKNATNFPVNMVIGGHIHAGGALLQRRISQAMGQLDMLDQLTIVQPSYMTNATKKPARYSRATYAAEAMYPPRPIGTRLVLFYPNKRRVAVVMVDKGGLKEQLEMVGLL